MHNQRTLDSILPVRQVVPELAVRGRQDVNFDVHRDRPCPASPDAPALHPDAPAFTRRLSVLSVVRNAMTCAVVTAPAVPTWQLSRQSVDNLASRIAAAYRRSQ